MLQKADLNIVKYRPITEDRFIPAEFRERIKKESIPEEMKEALLKSYRGSLRAEVKLKFGEVVIFECEMEA